MADARLDPVPALDNFVPELAYPTVQRVVVDTKTRRLFVRRGATSYGSWFGYPEPNPLVDTPMEHFWRILQDRTPVRTQPPKGDDSAFTADVPETPGVTRSSFTGEASGFGTRMLLVGGLGAASGEPDTVNTQAGSACTPGDREVVAGAISSMSLSDVSASASAASLDADTSSKADVARPATRCWPYPNITRSVGNPSPPEEATASLEEAYQDNAFSFDSMVDPEVGRQEGCTGDCRDDFVAECVEDDEGESQRRQDKGGFGSEVTCGYSEAEVTAASEGSLTPATARPDAWPEGAGALVVSVGESRSKATLKRGEAGLEAQVDSIARNVVIGFPDPSGALVTVARIGVVRAEATSRAAGQARTATGTFTRTVCGVDIVGGRSFTGCLEDGTLAAMVAGLNQALAGRAEVRLRTPDEVLLKGTPHGYQAGVQRRSEELFQDQIITKDSSLTVSGMEIIGYRGDDPARGAGRQIVQLAGVQAATSYGISCLYGSAGPGTCAEGFASGGGGGDGEGGEGGDPGSYVPGATTGGGSALSGTPDSSKGGGLGRALRRLLAVPADVLRLLFSSPREFGLMAAVWALLWTPCWLGERRRGLVAAVGPPG